MNKRILGSLVLLLVVGMFFALFLISCDELEGPYFISGISYSDEKELLYIQFKSDSFPPGLTIDDFSLSRGETVIEIKELSLSGSASNPVGYALRLGEVLTEGVAYKLKIERDEIKFIYAKEGADPEENEFFFYPLRILGIWSF